MPSENRVTVNLTPEFAERLKEYQKEHNIKSLAAALVELAATGLGEDIKTRADWGGKRK